MNPIHLGYVGAGFMAQKVHIPNFSSIPGCKLVALAEVRPGILKKVADRYQVERRYTSHLQMAQQEKLDAVAISGAYSQQAQLAIEFLKRGIPVFIEKPLATTVADAKLVLDAARTGGLPENRSVMVGYMKRYDAGNLLARDAIRSLKSSGQVGAITYARAHGFAGDWIAGLDTPFDNSDEPIPPQENLFQVFPAWLPPQWRNGYINFLQQYTHNINLLRWLLDAGDDARVLFADFEPGKPVGADGLTGVTVLSIAGVRAVLESGSLSAHTWDEHTQIYFQHAYVKTTSPSLLLRNIPAEVEIYRTRPTIEKRSPVSSPAYSWSYKNEAVAFIDAVTHTKPFDSSAEDTITDIRLYEEIYHAFLKQRGEV